MKRNINVSEVDVRNTHNGFVQMKMPFEGSMAVFNDEELLFYGIDCNKIGDDYNNGMRDTKKAELALRFAQNNVYEQPSTNNLLDISQVFAYNKPHIFIKNGLLSQYYILKEEENVRLIQTTFGIDVDDLDVKVVFDSQVYHEFANLIENDADSKTYIIDSYGRLLDICFNETERQIKKEELEQKKKGASEHSLISLRAEDNFTLKHNQLLFVVKLHKNNPQIKYVKLFKENNTMTSIVSCDIPVENYTLNKLNEILKRSMPETPDAVFSKVLKREQNTSKLA